MATTKKSPAKSISKIGKLLKKATATPKKKVATKTKVVTKKPVVTPKKKAVAPKSKKIDWSKVKTGQKFSATIDGKFCYGQISIYYGNVYFCQSVANGDDCQDKLGYPHSWFNDSYVKNVKLLTRFPKSFTPPSEMPKSIPINREGRYKVKFFQGHIEVGCQKITNSMVRKITGKLID
jgi:hypothetical protein